MAPSNHPFYQKDEKVLCFHHEFLYEAKVLDFKHMDENDKRSPYQYRVHYKGWKNTWDDWVPQDRIRKFTEENKELAANLKAEMDRTLNPPKTKAAAAKRKAAGSDLSSARGSEERLTPMTGRGQKRGRDYEIEKVRERPYIASNSYIEAPQSRPVTRKAKAESAASQQALLPSVKRSPTEITSASPSTQEDSDDGPPSQRRRRANNPPEADPDFISFRRTRRPVDNRGYQNHAKTSMIAGFPMDDPPSDIVKSMEAKRLRLNKGRIAQNRETIIFTDKKPFLEQEESFHQRPAVHIPVPDRLKALLVDDWEYVTKNLSLIPLPAENPVNAIIDAYFEEEKGKRRLGSPEASILEEVVAGTKEYFERSLGKILLYRFERQQYFEARKHLEAGQGEWENKTIGDVYGAEHLARLFVSLPELIAQTNMDEQSVRKLRDEITKMTSWLGKNSGRFFTAEYEAATPEYIEKSRGG